MRHELITLANEILKFSETDQVRRITIKHQDYSEMLGLFFSRQDEHLETVSHLVKAGQTLDAILIARSMAEGLAHIQWTSENEDSAKEYFIFADIMHCLNLRKYKKPITELQILFMEQHSHRFLAREKKAFFRNCMDLVQRSYRMMLGKNDKSRTVQWDRKKYIKDWFCAVKPNLTISKILRSTKIDSDLWLYSISSAIAHWEPWITKLLSNNTDLEMGIETNKDELAYLALQVAIKTHLLMLQLMNNHFKLGIEKAIILYNQRLEEIFSLKQKVK